MAGDEKQDKTSVYLERAKSLEGKARWAASIAFAILGAATALAKLMGTRIAQLELVIIGLIAAACELATAHILDEWAEEIWERLMRDPDRRSKAMLLASLGIIVFGLGILIAVIMGWW